MKILVIGTIDSGYPGREEALCRDLARGLSKRGHEVDVFFLPFKRDTLNAEEQIFAYSLVDTARADALVTVGYPACFVPHRNGNKASYLFDCYPEIRKALSFELRELRSEERQKTAENILSAERGTLAGIKHVFVATHALSREMLERYGVGADVLRPDGERLSERVGGAMA